MKRGGKKAQFFIIAAVIIAIIIIGIAGISNYIIVKEEPVGFYDLGETLELEGAQVIDYGIYNVGEDIDPIINAFIENYTEHLSKQGEFFEFIIVYGEQDNPTVKTCSPGEIGGVGGGLGSGTETGFDYQAIQCEPPEDITPLPGNKVEVELLNNTYEFDLGGNKNFFFVMGKTRGAEQDIYTG